MKNSLLPLVVYETARLLNEYKELNAFYTEGRIAYYRKVNIGVAVDIDDGLKVLTIFDHRVTEGMRVSQFLNNLKERVESYRPRGETGIVPTSTPVNSGTADKTTKCCHRCLKTLQEDNALSGPGLIRTIDGIAPPFCHEHPNGC